MKYSNSIKTLEDYRNTCFAHIQEITPVELQNMIEASKSNDMITYKKVEVERGNYNCYHEFTVNRYPGKTEILEDFLKSANIDPTTINTALHLRDNSGSASERDPYIKEVMFLLKEDRAKPTYKIENYNMNDAQKKLLNTVIKHLETLKAWYDSFNEFAIAFGYDEDFNTCEHYTTYENFRQKYNIGKPYSDLKSTSQKLYRLRKRFADAFPSRYYRNHLDDIGMCFTHVYCCILSDIIHPIHVEDERIRSSQGMEISQCLDFLKLQLEAA